MTKVGFLALTAGLLATVAFAPCADAQTINQKSKEKVRWYNAPREFQIIDDRPIVKDFREAPSAAQPFQMPPGPQSSPGFSGGGAGAMGDDGGGTLPAGGMPIPGGGGPGPGNLPYRTDNGPGLGNLPKADFSHAQSNIPARGMGPKGPLPGGFTTGMMGKVMPFNKAQPTMGNPAAGMANAARRANTATRASTPVASYGGGYGPSTGSSAGGSSTATQVHGKLLNRLK